jgi:transcriptional regulator with XRE-family HTH domain
MGNRMLDLAPVLNLHVGASHYGALVGARINAARLAAGWTPERLANALSDVLGVAVSARQLTDWEEGREEFAAGICVAAFDVMGISEAEAIGLRNPDVIEVQRLAAAVAKVRGLMNDPAALMRRASELLDGRAKPLLVPAVVALLSMRAIGGPPTQQYWTVPGGRRSTVAAARVME